jgi:hypothetical protein
MIHACGIILAGSSRSKQETGATNREHLRPFRNISRLRREISEAHAHRTASRGAPEGAGKMSGVIESQFVGDLFHQPSLLQHANAVLQLLLLQPGVQGGPKFGLKISVELLACDADVLGQAESSVTRLPSASLPISNRLPAFQSTHAQNAPVLNPCGGASPNNRSTNSPSTGPEMSPRHLAQ